MNIIRRKGFYYLGHSFRKGGKPVYRERYLGKLIPEDIETIKEAFLRKCLEEDVFRRIDFIAKRYRQEWARLPESIKKKTLLGRAIEFTYHSSAIEGSTITLAETQELIEQHIAPNKPIKDILEARSHVDIFFRAVQDRQEVSLTSLMQWHKDLFQQTNSDIAGQWRDYMVKVLHYRPPDWQDLDVLLKDFTAWYKKNKKRMHPIELAARAHYKFEKIHPFGDGNGRIGRLLILHILARAHYPLITIEQRHRKAYFHALTKTENNFLQFFIRGYFRKFKEYSN